MYFQESPMVLVLILEAVLSWQKAFKVTVFQNLCTFLFTLYEKNKLLPSLFDHDADWLHVSQETFLLQN